MAERLNLNNAYRQELWKQVRLKSEKCIIRIVGTVNTMKEHMFLGQYDDVSLRADTQESQSCETMNWSQIQSVLISINSIVCSISLN